MLKRLRTLIHEADPEVVEEVKWRKPSNPAGVPVWSDHGMICTGETYKDKVKLTFAGAPRSMTRRASSIRAWTAARGGRSISTKAMRSTRRPSKR